MSYRPVTQIFLLPGLILLALTGCLQPQPNEVVVYSALDREFSEPLLKDLEQELGYTIRPKFDQESNKTVGLANEIIQSRDRPVADIFWNNEILHTLRLQQAGLLDVYQSPELDRFPSSFYSPSGTWSGFAARARVLIINTDLLPNDQWPSSIEDLADPKWKGKCAVARPVFGTTATHAAVLIHQLGQAKGQALWTDIANNAQIVGGNKQVATKVAAGQFSFGLTDTDDAMIELEKGESVAIVFPDQKPDQMGTLVIPNTLALIKNGPNPVRAKKLIDRLLQADIEQRLAIGASAQLPLGQTEPSQTNPWRVLKHSSIGSLTELKIMEVDFEAAAKQWDRSKQFLEKL